MVEQNAKNAQGGKPDAWIGNKLKQSTRNGNDQRKDCVSLCTIVTVLGLMTRHLKSRNVKHAEFRDCLARCDVRSATEAGKTERRAQQKVKSGT